MFLAGLPGVISWDMTEILELNIQQGQCCTLMPLHTVPTVSINAPPLRMKLLYCETCSILMYV